MKSLRILFFLLFFTGTCLAAPNSEARLKMLYNSLDPLSLSQHLAFYELYPNTYWGDQALKASCRLLTGRSTLNSKLPNDILSDQNIQTFIALVNKPINQELPLIEPVALQIIERISQRLHHTSLKGHLKWSEEEVLALPTNEIDLARGLFISQFGDNRQRIRSYEALIDLMALQILLRLPAQAKPEEKIVAINAFIFDEMGFRFPPHSLYEKEIDVYTFLPSVLDSRRGVCLGVSILYLCIAQRLALPLEMITPPGHIYIRYRSQDKLINIETTARGVHIESEEYLGTNIRDLQMRTIREVIGMAHFNQASVYWQNGDFDNGLKAYQKAQPYMDQDPLLKEFMGYILLLTNRKEEGEKLLHEIKDHTPSYAIVKNTLAEDYFLGHIDAKGISILFSKVEQDRASLLERKNTLEKLVEKHPFFRAGILSLAMAWLQLHRTGEALEILKKYDEIEKKDPEAHYYLSVLHAQRSDYAKAWFHLKQAEGIVKKVNYAPKTLIELRRELLKTIPE